jgi:acetyl/propionyl-CoA carboxylase alpha subunit
VRVDTGVKAGATVTPHYDSLLAKIVAHGADRADAARRLSSGLGDLALLGVGSNQAFLRDIVDHPVFRAGDLTTAFLHEAFPEGWTPNLERPDFALAAALLWAERLPVSASPGPWSTLGGFRLFGADSARAWTALAVEGEGATSRIALSGRKGRWVIRHGEAETDAETGFAGSRFVMAADGMRRLYAFAADGEHIWVGEGGRTAQFRIRPWIETAGRAATVAAAGGNQLRAPMPGQINAMKVEPGQAVLAGETLAVLEAMKLLYALPAPASGRVTSVYAQTGDTVEIAASDPPPES